MKLEYRTLFKLLLFISFMLLLSSCTAGSEQFSDASGEGPAGFWFGLWHGVISVISLILHLFSDTIKVYEANNTGGWYDFGFLMGVIFVWGGGCHVKCKTAQQKKRDQEWDEIGNKIEIKVMRNLKNWSEDEEGDQEYEKSMNKEDWDEICEKVEQKLKRKIRDWAEKD